MKSYIKFVVIEIILLLYLFLFSVLMLHIKISIQGDFIHNYVTVFFTVQYISRIIFGILLYCLSTIRPAGNNEILTFAVLHLILGVAIIAFNILLTYGIIPLNNNYFFYWHQYGIGTSFVLGGFNIAYFCKYIKEYMHFRKNTISNESDS